MISKETLTIPQKSPLFLKIEQLFGIDLRALGIFRILIGVIILIDITVRAGSLVAHYTDSGIVSREALRSFGELPLYLSFNMLSGGAPLQIFLFITTAIAALALLFGYRTRIASVLCWALMLSLHVRNPFINNLGDWLLVDLLFFCMFIPLGARFSLGAMHMREKEDLPQNVLSIATLAIILQMCFLYYFSTYHKIMPDWHSDGTALAFALNLDRLTQPLGNIMRLWPPELLKALTLFVFYLEKWGPILFFLPFFTGPIRTLIAGCFIAFHAVLAVSVEIGVFPYICISAWILILPGWTFDRLASLKNRIHLDKLTEFISVQWHNILAFFHQFDKRKRPVSNRVLPNFLETALSVFGLWFILSSAFLFTGRMDMGYYDMLYQYVEPIGNSLNFQQRWDMFSPRVPRQDGWFVMAGHKQNGDFVNVFTGQPVTWERPELISATYRNQRWRKNMEWVIKKWDPHARLLAEYYWSDWNCSHPADDQLTRLDIVFMSELTLETLEPAPIERKVLYSKDAADQSSNNCQK